MGLRGTPGLINLDWFQRLTNELPERSVPYKRTKDATENPRLALPGLADCFVVTGDSVSMMIEIADCENHWLFFSLPSDWRGRI